MRSEKNKPMWLTFYNFICLTNLPALLWEFGPLHNLWEGGGMGKKFLWLVKPKWHGYQKNWNINLMDNILQKMAMQRIEQMQASWMVEDGEDEMTSYSGGVKFLTYSSEPAIRSTFE